MITDYQTLKTTIMSYMQAPDLGSNLDLAIQMCEQDINNQLRTGRQEARWQLNTVKTLHRYPVPSDFKGLRSINTQGTHRYTLRYLAPASIEGYLTQTGDLQFYSIQDEMLILAPPPGEGTKIEILYYQKVPALSDQNTTNWLLTEWPSIYLFGSLRHMHMMAYDEQRSGFYQAQYEAEVAKLQQADTRDRWSGDAMAMVAG